MYWAARSLHVQGRYIIVSGLRIRVDTRLGTTVASTWILSRWLDLGMTFIRGGFLHQTVLYKNGEIAYDVMNTDTAWEYQLLTQMSLKGVTTAVVSDDVTDAVITLVIRCKVNRRLPMVPQTLCDITTWSSADITRALILHLPCWIIMRLSSRGRHSQSSLQCRPPLRHFPWWSYACCLPAMSPYISRKPLKTEKVDPLYLKITSDHATGNP